MYSAIAANKRKSLLILVLFIGFASAIAYTAGRLYAGRSFAPYAVGAAAIYTIVSYLASSKVALAMNGAREVSSRDEPELYRVVENLAITDGLPTPKIYVIEDPALNAFASGRDPKNSVVCVTRGLLEAMDKPELEGVIAHELGHVKNYDIRVSMAAFAIVSVIGIISDLFLRSMFWGGLGDDDDNSSGGSILMVVGIVAIVLSPIIAALIQLAISRKREYLADATSALTTRYPEGLESALQKIAKHGSIMQRQSASTAHLFFASPLKNHSLANLFSTHPPIEDRIRALQEMGTKL